jgi:site-specific DNA-methyltransferase (adenine-specific)
LKNPDYINKIINDDCRNHLTKLQPSSIELVVSDIPYGISIDGWDVLHNNTNSALLGQSPAQKNKVAFKRRGKPINGWSSADRNIGKEYQHWCDSWAGMLYDPLKDGASVFIFGARRTIHRAIISLEDAGFILKDILCWKKPSAHHRAQRLSGILSKRGLHNEAKKWKGWRLGNLAPIWEPIAWLFKPYKYTITDNILKNSVGAMNIDKNKINGKSPYNLLKFAFDKKEQVVHQAQKPIELIKFLINLTTRDGHTVLDPFMGSGTTALASIQTGRKFIGFEINTEYHKKSINRISSILNEKTGS